MLSMRHMIQGERWNGYS